MDTYAPFSILTPLGALFGSPFFSHVIPSTPIQFAADAYDAIYAIKAAAEEADVTPDMDYSEMCDKLMDAMTKIKIDGLTGVAAYHYFNLSG